MTREGGGITANDNVGEVGLGLSYDGSNFDKKIEESSKKVEDVMSKAFEKAGENAAQSMDASAKKISAILADSEKSMKSKASSIAWVYRKEGMSASEAMKKAWEQIERKSGTTTGKVKKDITGVDKKSTRLFDRLKKNMAGAEGKGIRFSGRLSNAFSKTAAKMENSFTSSLKKIGTAIAGAFAVNQLIRFSKECLTLGSDLAEVQNVVDVTFPTMSKQIDTFAQNAVNSFGLSETMAKQFTGTFGAMSKAFGFSEKAALDMSETLTGLAGDVASFYNIDQGEAYTKLKSVFTGETETLKDLGVIMTQSALDAYAMANGYGKVTAKMSEQEKVALRYRFVLDKLALAQGDFARTSDGWANQTRILKLQFDSLKASIGQGLINVLAPVVQWINTILAGLNKLAKGFASFTAAITGKKSGGGGGGGSVSGELAAAAANADNLAGSVGGVGGAAKKAAKEVQKAFAGLDEITTLSKPVADSGGAGGGSAGGGDFNFGDLSFGNAMAEQAETSTAALGKIQAAWDRLKAEFQTGFSVGFGDIDFSGIESHLQGIGESVSEIFNSSEVQNAAQNWANACAESLGETIGSFARIGAVIAEVLVGGVDVYLRQNSRRIKEWIVSAFNISSQTSKIRAELSKALADIFQGAFSGDVSKQTVADVINIFATLTATSITLAQKLGRDILGALAKPIVKNKEIVTKNLRGLWGFISSIISTISDGVTATCAKIGEVYDQYIDPMFEKLGNGLSQVTATMMEAWNTYINPLLTQWGQKFKELWETHLQPAINSLLDFIGRLCNAIGILWEQWISPLISWLVSTIMPVLAPIINWIVEQVMNLVGLISGCVDSISQALSGLIDFVTGIFTGDWDTAWGGICEMFSGWQTQMSNIGEYVWNGITNFFSGIFDTIKGVFTAKWESIKFYVDTVLKKIATIVSTIWTGIKTTISDIISGIKTTVGNVFDKIKITISGAMGGIKKGIYDALEYLKGIFRNAFATIRDTVSRIFGDMWGTLKGIINSILGGVESMANGIVKALNKATGALNNMSFDVPTWIPGIGGKSFGFDIPPVSTVSIPRLAQGGYVKANTPRLAMIGDNRREGEIVAPESKIAEAVAKGLQGVLGSGGDSSGQTIFMLMEIIALLKENNELLRRLLDKESTTELTTSSVVKGISRKNLRDGKTVVPVG